LSANIAYSDSNSARERENRFYAAPYNPAIYAARLPQQIVPPGEKVIIVNPRVHAWGAYAPDGHLIHGGLASAGSNWCSDLGRPCHTHPGSYRIQSLGSQGCKSSIFPMPRGGAPMPYCMYFDGGQALHGSPEREVVDGNISHGCVRMHVQDAEWIRFNFATVGTRVIVVAY
jgi:hypothetical protein